MKKVFLIFSILFFTSCSYAVEELSDEVILLDEENIKPVLLEEEISPYTKKALKGIIEKEYSLDDNVGMFNRQLTKKFKSGPLEDIRLQGNFINTLGFYNDKNDTDFKYDTQKINIGFYGNFKSKKEDFGLLLDFTPMDEKFFQRLVLDAFIETTRIKNHRLLIGSTRLPVGYEGGQSTFLIPFLNRSQIARTLGNARKMGIRLRGDYKYIDYDIGGYSSDTYYQEFMPGVETDIWLNFKPLANIVEKSGNLNIGVGAQIGNRNSYDFKVLTSAIRYDYKKFWAIAEYGFADGYNGAMGVSNNEAEGYNLTLAYRLTKKLEFLLRYDEFDNNRKVANNDRKEYSAGINYFILGQTLRMMFNYVYCDNKNAIDSHRFILGSQVLL